MEYQDYADLDDLSEEKFEKIKLRESFTSKIAVPLLIVFTFTGHLISIMIF